MLPIYTCLCKYTLHLYEEPILSENSLRIENRHIKTQYFHQQNMVNKKKINLFCLSNFLLSTSPSLKKKQFQNFHLVVLCWLVVKHSSNIWNHQQQTNIVCEHYSTQEQQNKLWNRVQEKNRLAISLNHDTSSKTQITYIKFTYLLI